MKILVVKTLTNSLKPAYDKDMQVFNKMPRGEIFEIEYTKKRNVKFHRKYFALINMAFQNQDEYELMDDMREQINISAGFKREVVNMVTGEIQVRAKSINFSTMDELEFSELYERTKDVICKWLGVSNEQIDEEILQFF